MDYVRTWIPRLFVVAMIALAGGSALVATSTATNEQPRPSELSPFYTPASTVSLIPSSDQTTLPAQTGFRGIEDFCTETPLRGTMHYDGSAGGLLGVLTVSVAGLPAFDEINVDWSSDHIRAPVIASFETNANGTAIPSTVEVGRLGESTGAEIVLTAAAIPNPVLGRLEPC